MNITLENYHEKIVVADNSCWIWAGWINPKLGYGHVYWNRKRDMAHRVFYQLFKGNIPNGLQIDHTCAVRSCVNPSHLRAVTLVENVMAPHSQSRTAISSRQTHCKRGHLLSGDNVALLNNGRRRSCKTCHKMTNALGYQRRKNEKRIA